MIYITYAYISEEKHELLLQKQLANFPVDFQQKIINFRRWQDAQLSLIGRLLLSQSISENSHRKTGNSKIAYTKYNKPYFEDEELNFNISHSGEIVVCAISETCNLGIDIELLKITNIHHFKAQMTTNEWNTIVNATDQQIAFYTYWTQKEAVIKAHGNGLSIPLQSFEIENHKTDIDSQIFYGFEVELDKEYMCYVACNKKIKYDQIHIKKIDINDLCMLKSII